MASKLTKFKVAAAHAAPVFMDKAATIKKTVRLIEQARAEDIKLLVFPETFIPGYPVRQAAPSHQDVPSAKEPPSTSSSATHPSPKSPPSRATPKRASSSTPTATT